MEPGQGPDPRDQYCEEETDDVLIYIPWNQRLYHPELLLLDYAAVSESSANSGVKETKVMSESSANLSVEETKEMEANKEETLCEERNKDLRTARCEWSEDECNALLEAYKQQSVPKSKRPQQEGWKIIANVVNSINTSMPKTVQQCKDKLYNLMKQIRKGTDDSSSSSVRETNEVEDKKKTVNQWSKETTMILLEAHWQCLQPKINSGRRILELEDWDHIATVVNTSTGGQTKTRNQCLLKIDNLRRKYRVKCEKTSVGDLPVKWPYFAKVKRFVNATDCTP